VLRRTSALGYIEFVLWVYALTPFVRRVIDARIGYTELSTAMLAPGLAVAVGIPALLHPVRRVGARVGVAMGFGTLALGYAFAIGVLRVGPNAAIAGLVEWLMPVLLGWQVATAATSDDELWDRLGRSLVWLVLVTGAYGLFQWSSLPQWDLYWMVSANVPSVGLPAPREFRVWSTMNSPGPFAAVIGAAVVVVSRVEHRWRMPALLLGYATLALSLVRSAWIGWGIAMIALLLVGTRRPTRRIGAVVLVAVGIVTFFVSGAGDPVIDRFDETTGEGASDDSLTARLEMHQYLLPRIAAQLQGSGLGSTGTATKLDSQTAEVERFSDVDGGLIEHGYVMGGLIAGTHLVLTGAALWWALRRAAAMGPIQVAAAAGALGLFVQLAFGNPLIGTSGVVFWVLLGALGRSRSSAVAPVAP